MIASNESAQVQARMAGTAAVGAKETLLGRTVNDTVNLYQRLAVIKDRLQRLQEGLIGPIAIGSVGSVGGAEGANMGKLGTLDETLSDCHAVAERIEDTLSSLEGML